MPRFDVFGRIMTVTRLGTRWQVTVDGADGKHRDARVRIPDSVSESELVRHLADLFHESATPDRPDVVRLQ